MSKINKKRPIYVLDTNVLLYNPKAVYAFPDADVVIPDIVLGELDKIKTSRADRELRYRSRQISRILFDLSEHGKLTDGIPFAKNSVLRVMNFDPSKGNHDKFGSKNSDDRILSVVYQLNNDSNGRPVTIVTNDLNMLLKAQTLGIKVEHPGEEFAYSGVKRALFRLKANKKPVWTTVAAVAIIAFFMVLKQYPGVLGLQTTPTTPEGPADLMKQFSQYQSQVTTLNAQKDTYESILKKSPKDIQALYGLGNTYFDLAQVKQDQKTYQKAIDYYKKALDVDPSKSNIRTDMAVAYNFLGMTDIATVELNKVVTSDPSFFQAYFNLGVIKYQQNDLEHAKQFFQKVLEKAPQQSPFASQAEGYLQQIDAQAKGAPKK